MKVEIDAVFLNEINSFIFSSWKMLKETGHKEMADALYDKFCGPIYDLLDTEGYFKTIDQALEEVRKCSE